MRTNLRNKEDVLALVIRRKWWIVVSFTVFCAAVTLVTWLLPPSYVSEALIIVNERGVPEEYVDDLNTETVQRRLTTIEQTVLSRPSLLQVVRALGSRLPELEGLDIDKSIARLRERIDIQFQTEPVVSGRVPAVVSFTVAYQNRDPELAQLVVNELTRLFLQQDDSARTQRTVGLTDFLAGERVSAASQLQEAEQELEAFRSRNAFALPEQLGESLRSLDQLRADLRTNQIAIDRTGTTISNLQVQIAATPEMNPPPPQPAPDPVVEQHRLAVLEYEEALERYRPDHPIIKGLKLRVDLLARDLPPEPEYEIPTGPVANPLYQNLVAQLRQNETERASLASERDFIESEIGRVNARIARSPAIEQEMAELLRKVDEAQQHYDDLSGRLSEASLSSRLDGQQGGSLFSVLAPASLPLDPAKPNRRKVLLAGILLSLGAAVGIGLLVDIARQKVSTHSEIEHFWGVPVLVEIPAVVTDADVAAGRRRHVLVLLSSIGAAAAYGFCLYLVYLHPDVVIQPLDPILQRLVY